MGIDGKENIFDNAEDAGFEEEYMKRLDAGTPDLWDRIEEGVLEDLPYSEPVVLGNEDDYSGNKKKLFTFPHMAAVLIAAAAVLLVAVSGIFIIGNRTGKSDGTKAEEGWWNRLAQGSGKETDNKVQVDMATGEESYEMTQDGETADTENPASGATVEENTVSEDTEETQTEDETQTEEASTTEEITTTTEAPVTTENGGSEKQEPDNTEEPATDNGQTGISGKYVMVNGYMYKESGESTSSLPSGFEYAGAVTSASVGMPDRNMQSLNIPVGAGIYTSPSNNYVIYIEISGGTYEQYVID